MNMREYLTLHLDTNSSKGSAFTAVLQLVRKDMVVNEHESISNITLKVIKATL